MEAQFLHSPFHVPVNFSQPHEVRQRPSRLLPEFSFWHGPRFKKVSPSPIENFIRDQHRHIATHPLTILGDVLQCFDHALAALGIEVIELCDVRPWREIRISTASNEQILTTCPLQNVKGRGIAPKILFAALDVTVGMLHYPAMVEAGMVGYEVEN